MLLLTIVIVIAALAALRAAQIEGRKARARAADDARLAELSRLCGWSRESACVAEFHHAFGQPVRTTPSLDVPETELRLALIREEVRELEEAVAAGDLQKAADALGDIEYVVHGAAHTWGIPADAVFAAIHRSNMTKLGPDGKPIYGDGHNAPLGKVLKGPGYTPPDADIAAILKAAADDAQVTA